MNRLHYNFPSFMIVFDFDSNKTMCAEISVDENKKFPKRNA